MKTRIAILLLCCSVPFCSFAYVLSGTHYAGDTIQVQLGDICDSVRFPLTPGTCAGSVANPDWRLEIQTAVARWNSASTNFVFTTNPAAGAATPGVCDSDDPNSAFFLADICGDAFGGSTLAVAVTFSFFEGTALHSDVIFNSAWTWGAFDDALTNHPGVNDFRRVAVHEFGHVTGLGHAPSTGSIMFPSIQDVIAPQPDDIAGLSANYGVSMTFAIPDQNANSVQELVHVRRTSTGGIVATIRDASTGAVLRSMSYLDSGHHPLDAVLLPDEDGNGAPELAILTVRVSDQRGVVQIRNISGSENPRNITFAQGTTPMQLKNIGDADGNGVSELAMMGIRETDVRNVVEIRNSFGAAVRRDVVFSDFTSPVDLDVIFDPLAVAAPRLALLTLRWSDLRGVVEMRNAFGAQAATHVNARTGVTPVAVSIVYDTVPRVAILSIRDSDLRPLVQLKNAAGPPNTATVYFSPGHAPLNFTSIDDADGDGKPDLAVVAYRFSDGRVNTQLSNVDATNFRLFIQNPNYDATGSLTILDDADGDTFPELGILLSRRTDARVAVDWKNAAGPNTAAVTRIFMSP